MDPETGEPHFERHGIEEDDVRAVPPRSHRPEGDVGTSTQNAEEKMSADKFPPGWDEKRVREVASHYDSQSDEDAAREDEEAWSSPDHVAVLVPRAVYPKVIELIERECRDL